MSTDLAVSQQAAPLAQRAEPRRRGELTLAAKVVEKIAGQAAAEIGTTRGKTGGVLGIGAQVDTDARPKVDVDLSATSADIAIAVGIAYPGSIREATRQMRDHVTRQVRELTGVEVHRLDIDVTFLSVRGHDDARSSKGALR